MNFHDIPMYLKSSYHVDIDWSYLEEWLVTQIGDGVDLQLDPDFQRAHVWDDEKRRRYVEYSLRGGMGARDIYFNMRGWNDGVVAYPLQLVDGKQRMEAARCFMRSELEVFGGHLFKDIGGFLRFHTARFHVNINDLETRAQVLQWYLDLNDGGVVHTSTELDKVRALLDRELS